MNRKSERKLWTAALISLLVWMAAGTWPEIPAQQAQMFAGYQKAPSVPGGENRKSGQSDVMPENLYQLAWWGCLYPRTCLRSAMELVEEQETAESETAESATETQEIREELPVKIRWKCMDLF